MLSAKPHYFFLALNVIIKQLGVTMYNTTSVRTSSVMMTSSNENIFRVTGPLWRESTGHRWIPLTNANDAELWSFLRSAPEQMVEHSSGRRFEAPPRSLLGHCSVMIRFYVLEKGNRSGTTKQIEPDYLSAISPAKWCFLLFLRSILRRQSNICIR